MVKAGDVNVSSSPSSRILVQNLPKYLTEERLRKHVELQGFPPTDVRIVKRPDGKSRCFGFVGFRSEDMAAQAVRHFDRSFVDTSRLRVTLALPQGHADLPRPWSAHSFGSSTHRRRYPHLYDANGNLQKGVTKSQQVKKTSKTTSALFRNIVEKEKQTQDDPTFRAEMEKLADTGRVYIVNLPFSTTEDELKKYCEKYGKIADLHMLTQESTGQPVGRAFVTFTFPEDAVQALPSLQGAVFQGRILKAVAASAPPDKKTVEKVQGAIKKATSSYKRKLEERKKAAAADSRTWNLLYVSANAATDAVAAELGLDKEELLDFEAGDMAARVALGETKIVHQTKAWLEEEGIDMKAFERTGVSVLTSDLPTSVKRSKDTFIVKNLPYGTTADDLRELFSRHGVLLRFCLSPSKTVAVVQYLEEKVAARAFFRLAFRPFQSFPLYLEWAPEGIFIQKAEQETASSERVKEEEMNDDDDEQTDQSSTLFVKNLNFKTTEDSLTRVFSTCEGLRCATIKMSRPPASVKKETRPARSMGYGYIEFSSPEFAISAMKRFQGIMLDDHALELQISHKKSTQRDTKTDRTVVGASRVSSTPQPSSLSEMNSSKLLVRNLAFEATKKDLRLLCSGWGTLVAVRIPKKADGSSRGYGFVEYSTKRDAFKALEALKHTHLYGRHLVIEPVVDETNSVENAQAKAKRQLDGQTRLSAAKRRKLVQNLEQPDPNDDGSASFLDFAVD